MSSSSSKLLTIAATVAQCAAMAAVAVDAVEMPAALARLGRCVARRRTDRCRLRVHRHRLGVRTRSAGRSPLGIARSDLVVASRDDDGRTGVADLAGAVVATHLPVATERWFRDKGVDITVVAMGGALEGVCAAGLADGIVDLRETGTSLGQNRLRVLAEIASCQSLLVHNARPAL